MMFVFSPSMFAGFLGTAGLFHKPLLEIEVFGTATGSGSELFGGLHYWCVAALSSCVVLKLVSE